MLFFLHPAVSEGQEVVFSHEGGFYADTFCLALGADSAGMSYAIHYTLNGNEPTECDARYSLPLRLSADCYSHSDLFRVQTVPDDRWFEPREVEHIIVVRAALFDSAGCRRSAVATQAYLIDSLLGRRITLPVVSLCADTLSLFDYDTGIFVRGWYHDPSLPYTTGNYFQRGRWWERRASFTFFDTDGRVVVQDCGLRVHGNSQRVLAQKGLSLYARRDYGERAFRHPFFPERQQERYKRLVLRPWKTSWSEAGVEDWLCQRLAEPLRFDNLASRPVVLFLNGEYWGIYFLEEKADEHYIEERHGVKSDEVDLLAYWGDEVENGRSGRWRQLYEWLLTADLKREEDYRHLCSQVDVEALLDYMLMQVLVLNDDWPVNNVRFWSTTERPWRWIFFDGDGALATFPNSADILDYMTCRNVRRTTHSTPKSTLLFRRLYANPDFRRRSYARLKELVETPFAYEHTAPLLKQIADEVAPEVPYQIRRFDTPSSMTRWQMALAVIDDFLRLEPQAMVDEYAQYFGLAPEPRADGAVTRYDRYGRIVTEEEGIPGGIYYETGGGEVWKVRVNH